MLKQQQEEYEKEGLEWVHINYFNNQIICDLVDIPHKGKDVSNWILTQENIWPLAIIELTILKVA